jgi:hypothetical protein
VQESQANRKKILITGIVRNIQGSIEKDFAILTEALSALGDLQWFLVESDSSDESLSTLEALSKTEENFYYKSLGNLQKPGIPRTVAMARCRNEYLREVRENPRFEKIDYVVVSDFNQLNDRLTKEAIESCFVRSDWDACFANQTGRYYDIWALRHAIWSPNDCWEQLNFYRKYTKFPEWALRISIGSRMIRIPKGSEWIQVDSAFGGLGLYKRDAILQGEYVGSGIDGNPICEHVPFHTSLIQNGFKLFINPALINTKSTDHSQRMGAPQTIFRISKYPIKFLNQWVSKALTHQ